MSPIGSSPGDSARREIELLAYFAWEKDGRPPGRSLEYWLEAESQYHATRHFLEHELDKPPGRHADDTKL